MDELGKYTEESVEADVIGFETCAGKGARVTPVSEPTTFVVGSATEVDDKADEDETRYQEDCERKMR